MKRSGKIKWVLGGAVALLAGGYGVLMQPKHPTTVQAEEAAVSSALQRGQGRADVERYLQQRGLEFSYIGSKEDLSFESEIVRMGVPLAKLGGAIVAGIDDTHRELLTSESLSFTFLFDRQDRLLDWKIRPIYTGP